jgi:hypothetical protein
MRALATLSLVALGALVVTAVRVATADVRGGASEPVAEPAVRAEGVAELAVLADAPRALDVRFIGPAGVAHLEVRAAAAEVAQRLDGFGAALAVRTARDRITVDQGGAAPLIARREAAGWAPAPLGPATAAALARLLVLDRTLAVQGSSLVFGGDAYVACTVRCSQAAACTRRAGDLARCADDLVVCAACLVREP